MADTVDTWNKTPSRKWCRALGVRAGWHIVDIGCRVGRYTVPLARTAGKRGVVWGMDNNPGALAEVAVNAAEQGVDRPGTLVADFYAKLPFGKETCDLVLLYDMLHMLHKAERVRLYKRVARILRHEGILTVHVPHLNDGHGRLMTGMTLDDVAEEVCACGYSRGEDYAGTLSHGDGVMESTALIFSRS